MQASAIAWRKASWPSLPMPTQSNATSTTGFCSSACSTMPRAESGSFTPVAGGTSPSHSGEPGGGVTSTLNVRDAEIEGEAHAGDTRSTSKSTD